MPKVSESIAKFKKVDISYDYSSLSPDIKNALPHLKKAFDLITTLFLRQQMEGLPEIYEKVMKEGSDEKKEFWELFKGPWSQLEDFKSLYPEFTDRPPTCAFYPSDITKEEWDKALSEMNDTEKEMMNDTYSVIVRENGKLKPIPYHIYFAEELGEIFDHIENAAECVENKLLKEYLISRAEGLVTGNYRDSESLWVKMKDVPIDPVFGPFEVYADGFLGLKATYEAFLMVVDHEKGNTLKEIENNLPELAKIFPVPAGSKPALGKIAPMVVAHQIYSSGEAAQGIMASAFNLPNDAWVRGNVGWKQVMIYNIMQAKFNNCTMKIADRISHGKIQAEFDPYFYFVLMHEVSHGLGPAYRADGTPVAKAIGKNYTAIEEAKADIGGLYILLKLNGNYGIPTFTKETTFNSFFAGLFRSMRFGVHEAHGAANVIEYSWLKEKGVIKVLENGDFETDSTNLLPVVEELLDVLCTIEASATTEEAAEFIKKYAVPGQDILDALAKLDDIPIDIRVEYKL
ncbi:MAG: dipeptidyl-peptidase 3 family protein [bacterium]